MTKKQKWFKNWLPQWPTQPNQYRLKKMYQLYYLMEGNLPYRLEIQVLAAVKEGAIVNFNSVDHLLGEKP
jgi:hypothetical protein